MSFTEQQREEIRRLAHQELKRILDAGLMMTEEVDRQAAQPAKTQAPQTKEYVLSPTLDAVLKYEVDPATGVLWAKVKNHLDEKQFAEVPKEIQEICGVKYEPRKGWPLP